MIVLFVAGILLQQKIYRTQIKLTKEFQREWNQTAKESHLDHFQKMIIK
jgi:hypothetical protein